MAITLYQFPPGPGRLPCASPFCMKLETYLHMSGLDHQVKTILNPGKGPAGKAPFIELNGERLPDSRLIIERLERDTGGRVDGWLSDDQRAEALAWQRLMEEDLYWVIVYSRWLDEYGFRHWVGVTSGTTGLPRALVAVMTRVFRRTVRRDLRGKGFPTLGHDTVYRLGAADLAALAHRLSEAPFLFGDRPTSFDAMLAAHIGSIVEMPWEYPLKTAAQAHPNLVAHYERVMAQHFAERVG